MIPTPPLIEILPASASQEEEREASLTPHYFGLSCRPFIREEKKMPLSTHQATAAAAATALLLLLANGESLRTSLTSYSFSHSSAAVGLGLMSSTTSTSTLSQGSRLDQLESSIAAVRKLLDGASDGSSPQWPPPPPAAAQSAVPKQSDPAAQLPEPQLVTSSPPPPPPSKWRSRRVLTYDDFLGRVPVGGLAFVALANSAYSQMGVNWALLLLPVLERIGQSERAVLAALDDDSERAFLARELPTIRCGLGSMNASSPGARISGDFRWQMGSFRSMGVTKAELIIWLLRSGRDACISDVDSAWILPPFEMLASLPEADVLAGTDCLHVHEDDDRTHRAKVVSRCGHHVGSYHHAWFNTGVLFFRANRPHALAIAVEWRERMASVKGNVQVRQVDFDTQSTLGCCCLLACCSLTARSLLAHCSLAGAACCCCCALLAACLLLVCCCGYSRSSWLSSSSSRLPTHTSIRSTTNLLSTR